MTTSARYRFALMTLLVCCAPPLRAAPPSGLLAFSFNSATTALYDLTGTYDLDQQIVGTGGATVDLHLYAVQIEQDGQGRLTATGGGGTIMVGVGQDFVAADYTVRGSISGGGNSPTRVSMQVHLSGKDIIAGFVNGFVISIQYDLEIVEGALSGTARGSAHFSNLKGGPIRSSVSLPLPPGMDGSWTLALDVLPLSGLSGSGLITLSNGRLLGGHIQGVYLPASGESKVSFRGALEQTILLPVPVALTGNNVEVMISPDASRVNRASGKLLGQTVME